MNSIYVQVNGGTGLNVSFSQIIPELKEQYGEIAVCSPYWDLFASRGDCLVYKPEEMRDFLMDGISKKAKLVVERLYDKEAFIYKKQSYEDAWRDLCGLKPKKHTGPSTTKSDFPLFYEKFPQYKNSIEDIKNQLKEKGFEEYIITQFTGGQSPLVQVPVKDGKADWSQVPYDYEHEPLKRHYPIDLAQKWYNLFREKHPNVAVVSYQLPNEPSITGDTVVTLNVPYLLYHMLAKDPACKGTVSIDSSLQHLVAGVTKSVVIWGHSLPENFGYEYNKNIVQDCRRDDIFYFTALGPSGAAIRYIKPEELEEEVEDYLFKGVTIGEDGSIIVTA